MSSCQGETTDTFLADFAVGVNARFIKVGAPVRGERTVQINRLLQIEEQLETKDKLKPLEPNAFPHIAPPLLPEPEEGEGEAQTEEEAKKDGKKK